jgi:CBS domain-containing protein
VKEAVSPEPFCVNSDTPLNEVIRVMIEKNYGSAIISEGDQILGIFTVTDALRALLDRLEEK